jgi:nucleotide-binding universal stress UspA family protein
MKMYQKVLVPLDGSSLSECTLSHVKSLIKDGAAGEITLLNIMKIDLPWTEMDAAHFDINALRKPLFASSRKYLSEVQNRLSSEGIKAKTESLEANSPAYAITDYAQKHGMELIVMATHGYTGLKKIMMGSVASGVLHSSPVPVLLIRPESCRI